MDKYYITEEAFEKIFSYLTGQKNIYCKNRERTRTFLEGVGFIMRTGAQWRALPKYYGHFKTVHKRFLSWAKKDIWNSILFYFSQDCDVESIMLDGSVVRAHACASGYKKNSQEAQALGRSKGGFTTKIHALVDALGNPLRFILTPGQSSEIKQASKLIEGIQNRNVLGDKAYDCDAFIQKIESQNCVAIIPPKENRKIKREVDYILYKERHLIECFFSKVKQFRRVFSRFDKMAVAYMGFLAFASTIISLR
jgi:transposase